VGSILNNKKQQGEEQHMNGQTQFGFNNTEGSSPVQQAASGKQKHTAQPPKKWSMRVDLPQVREAQTDANGNAVRLRDPAACAAACADIQTAAQELFICFDLNSKNGVIDRRLVTLGILDASLVHPREVFRGAILAGAAAVILTHCHPSGDPTPSAEDIRITRQLVDAGRILGIRVLDHVIIGRPSHCSLREQGLVSFEA
jgi:DNA repair protein RadC